MRDEETGKKRGKKQGHPYRVSQSVSGQSAHPRKRIFSAGEAKLTDILGTMHCISASDLRAAREIAEFIQRIELHLWVHRSSHCSSEYWQLQRVVHSVKTARDA